MDDQRVGRVFREVRIRKAWRQLDLADKAGVSQGLVSRIELGRLSGISLARIRKIAAALDIRISLDAWWRSGEVDRLIDRGHAALVEYVVASLKADGWLTRVEVTFNRGGPAMAATTVDRGRRDPAWVRGHLVPPVRANGQCHGPRTAGAARPTASGRAVMQPARCRPMNDKRLLPPPAAP